MNKGVDNGGAALALFLPMAPGAPVALLHTVSDQNE